MAFTLDCISEIWRLFQKIFSSMSAVSGWFYFFFFPTAAPSLPHSSTWPGMRAVAQPLHLGKCTAEHRNTGNSIFKASFHEI